MRNKFLEPIDLYPVVVAIFIATIVLLVTEGCNRVVPKDINQPPPPPVTALTFDVVKGKIFQPYCLQCHTGGARDLSKVESVMRYVVAGDPKNSRLCQIVESREMPLGKELPDDLIDSLCKWILQGAKS